MANSKVVVVWIMIKDGKSSVYFCVLTDIESDN